MNYPPRRNRERWTNAEDDYLREMIAEISAAEIGEILGRSTMSVYKRIILLGVDNPRRRTRRADTNDLIVGADAVTVLTHWPRAGKEGK